MSKRIMIGIPVNRWLSPQFSISLSKVSFYLIQNNWTLDINYDNGSILSAQRDKIMIMAQKEKMDLLFIDSDMVFDQDAVESILACDQGDLRGGMCFMRRFPYQAAVFAQDKVDKEYVFTGMKLKDIPSYPFRCAAVGCAFLYVPIKTINIILDEYDHPFNNYEMKNGECLGEDLSFFYRCNKLKLKTVCVPSVEIGHITERIITRNDHEAAIGFVNKQKVSAAS